MDTWAWALDNRHAWLCGEHCQFSSYGCPHKRFPQRSWQQLGGGRDKPQAGLRREIKSTFHSQGLEILEKRAGDPPSWGKVTGGPRRGQARPSLSRDPRSLTALSRAPRGESSSKANVYIKRLFLEDCLVWCWGRHSTPTRPTSELQTETAGAGLAGCCLLHPADPSSEGCCCLALAYPENPRDFCGASPSALSGLMRGCQHTHSTLSIWKAWQSQGAPARFMKQSFTFTHFGSLASGLSPTLRRGGPSPASLPSQGLEPGSSGLSSPPNRKTPCHCHPPRGQAQGSGEETCLLRTMQKERGGGDKGSNKPTKKHK